MSTTQHPGPHADIASMLDRMEAADLARRVDCPACDAGHAQRCVDRWGHRTSLVHAARATRAGVDVGSGVMADDLRPTL